MNDIQANPRIWLVIGDKPGDNAQVEIIAEALGMPFETRRVLPKQQFVLGKPRFRPSLYHLDMARSDRLEPPWPDVILTIGRRPSMAALWIQEQSGGHSRIILLGRPKKWIARFDLVIVPGQYQVPQRPNVLQLNLPLMRPNEAAVAAAAEQWKVRLGQLQRPLTALFVGGQTKPFRFDAGAAAELVEGARRARDDSGGTLYISTSRRTPAEVTAALRRYQDEATRLYCWDPDHPEDNPYLALLGLADRFIVTGDSVSMMVEVARRGKPLAIFPLPYQRDIATRLRLRLAAATQQAARIRGAGRIAASLARSGVAGYSRDLTAIHQFLYRQALGAPLGAPFPPGGRKAEDELERVIDRIRALLAQC
jgi:mitochondrial fission protein ELM1